MSAAGDAVGRFLARARARTRLLAAAGAALGFLQVALLLLLLGLPPAVLAWSGSRSAYILGGVTCLLAALVLAARSAFRAVPDRDLAWRIERSEEGATLGDALRTSVELAPAVPAGGRPGTGAVDRDRDGRGDAISSHLIARHREATASALSALDPGRTVPYAPLRAPLVRCAALVALVLVIAVANPSLLSRYRAALAGGARALPLAAEVAVAGPGPGFNPVLAGITLTYRYPAYTGLKDRTVEGAAGEIRALAGTEVDLKATTDRPVVSGRLVLDPGEPVPLAVAGGRAVSATIAVRSAGFWQAELASGAGSGSASLDPVRHPIAVDEDVPPTVTLAEPASDLEVDELATLEVAWTASDDFGLSDLALVIERQGQKESRPLPRKTGAREASGTQRLALKPYALGPGDELALWVEAHDNDTVGGPKRGVSATRRVRIRAAATQHDGMVAQLETLFEDMVQTLDVALSASAPGPHNVRPSAEIEDQIAGRLASHRTLLDDVLRAMWQDPLGSEKSFTELSAMALRLGNLAEESASILRREAPALARPLGDDALVRTLGDLREKETGELETDVLALDEIVHREKAAVLKDLARSIAEDQKTLASLLEEHRRTGNKAVLEEATRLMARMKAKIAEFERRMASSERTMAEEFVNMDAIREQLEAASSGSMAELEKKLREGDFEGAARQAEELAARLARAAAQFEQGSRAMGALGQRRAADDLARAAQRVEALRDAESRVVESADALKREQETRRFGAGKDSAEFFARESKRAAAVAEQARAAAGALDQDPALQALAVSRRRHDELAREAGERIAAGAGAASLEDLREELFRLRSEVADPALGERLDARDRLESAAKQAAEAAQALGARSLDSALDAAHAAARRLQEARRRMGESGAGSEGVAKAAEQASELVLNLEALQRVAEGGAGGGAEGRDGGPDGRAAGREGARLGEMARKQRSLRSEASEVKGLVDRIAEENPKLPADLGTNLGQAGDYMDVAARGLDSREVGDGHRNAVAARDRLDEALRALQKAEQACSSPGSGEGSGSGQSAGAMSYLPSGVQGQPRFGGRDSSSGGGRGQEGMDGGASADKVAIPQDGEVRAPESFRKDVLEGMKEPRPRGWEETLEQYYRRLVR